MSDVKREARSRTAQPADGSVSRAPANGHTSPLRSVAAEGVAVPTGGPGSGGRSAGAVAEPAPGRVQTRGPLHGRVALVTGAARGIGRAIALELARAGAAVALNYPDATMEPLAREVEAEIAELGGVALPVRGDVSVVADTQAMVREVIARFGQIDVLVNNAGITRDRTLRKLTAEDWQRVIEVDLSSVFYCTSAAVPSMIEHGYGRVVSISSIVAQSGNFGQTNYAAAKAGILGFTRSAALELAKHGITVNAVCPGFTETPMTAQMPEPVLRQLVERIPLGRMARPEEIAGAVRFLAENGYVTGEALNVNGGLWMG